jgi:hypothetical protein
MSGSSSTAKPGIAGRASPPRGKLRAIGLLLRGLAVSLLLVLSLLVGLWLALESAALVPQTPAITANDIARAMQLLQQHNPNGKLPGITHSLTLSQRDLELLIHQAGHRFGETRARVHLQAGLAKVQVSLASPSLPPGIWLNLDVWLREDAALPQVEQVRLGGLRVPCWLAEQMLPWLLEAVDLRRQSELVQRLLVHVGFSSQGLALAYAWTDQPLQALASSLLPATDLARLLVYAQAAARAASDFGSARQMSMTQLLPPVFALARQRSVDAASAILENRAALMALALMVNPPSLSLLLPHAPLLPLQITLLARIDMPQHFLVSAALAAEASGVFADAVGLYKEVADSQGGSGFNFHDLTADRAGSRFGLQAIRHPQALQARLAAGVQEHELMPAAADLPEALSAQEFQRRFGGVGGPAYRQMMAKIEARLDRLSLFAP